MSPFPVLYKISNQTVLASTSAIWNQPLPENRHGEISSQKSSVSYGTYFQAVQIILAKQQFQLLQTALSMGYSELCEQVKELHIQLEKHGAFYHPAQISIYLADGQKKKYVANVACHETGLKQLEIEIEALQTIEKKFHSSFLPEYYGSGSVAIYENQRISLFLAEWFTDFYEFHASSSSNQKSTSVLVWNPDGKDFFLTEEEKKFVYQQCSYILTSLYDFSSCREIFPWHHAAGDFIVSKKASALSVKLITARRYGSIFDEEVNPSDLFQLLESLSCFLQTMAVKMSIDRYEGVGELVFIGNEILSQIVEGFFRALQQKKSLQNEISIVPLFQLFLVKNEKTWYEIAQKSPFRVSATDRFFLHTTQSLDVFFKSLYLECLKWEPQDV